jgi:hypothetical protein
MFSFAFAPGGTYQSGPLNRAYLPDHAETAAS